MDPGGEAEQICSERGAVRFAGGHVVVEEARPDAAEDHAGVVHGHGHRAGSAQQFEVLALLGWRCLDGVLQHAPEQEGAGRYFVLDD